MKRFEFNLQSVRDLRDSEESHSRAEYAQAMRLMEAFNIRRREIDQAIEDNLKESRQECGRPTRSDLVTSLRDMLAALKGSNQGPGAGGSGIKKTSGQQVWKPCGGPPKA